MFNFKLFDGGGGRRAAGVSEDQELCVIGAPHPPFSAQKVEPFRQYLTDDGLSSGSSDMAVDGSATNIDFYVGSHESKDRYITALNFIVAYGSNGAPYQWADGTALTNGSRLFYNSPRGEVDIHDSLKINQDFFRLIFAPIVTAWEIRGVGALNDYGYFISMDLTKMGLPYGIKLDAGTNQRLTMTIRDNVATDADNFDCIAYGFNRFK